MRRRNWQIYARIYCGAFFCCGLIFDLQFKRRPYTMDKSESNAGHIVRITSLWIYNLFVFFFINDYANERFWIKLDAKQWKEKSFVCLIYLFSLSFFLSIIHFRQKKNNSYRKICSCTKHLKFRIDSALVIKTRKVFFSYFSFIKCFFFIQPIHEQH